MFLSVLKNELLTFMFLLRWKVPPNPSSVAGFSPPNWGSAVRPNQNQHQGNMGES
jgi:hypothetical protein